MNQENKYFLKAVAAILVPLFLGMWWLTSSIKLLSLLERMGAYTFIIVTIAIIIVMMIRLKKMQRIKKQNRQLRRALHRLPLALQTILTKYQREARWQQQELLAITFLAAYGHLFLEHRPDQVIALAERGELARQLLPNYNYIASDDRDFCDETLRAAVRS